MSEEKVMLAHDIEQMFDFATEGLIKGYSHVDLMDKIGQQWMNAPVEEIERQIKRAVKAIREETLVDIDKIIPLHIEMYEEIYREADDMRSVGIKLRAMKAKEKLVGLHRETNVVEIHNEMNVEHEVEPQYNLTKLSSQEQKRLMELLKKIER